MKALAAILCLLPLVAGAAVPERCRSFQRFLTQEAHSVIGINAPMSVLGAQIQQESACDPLAESWVGASGLTQFMPATAADMARNYPNTLGPMADPLNWKWAIQAQVRYMRDLVSDPWRTRCDTWAAKLASYNGGEGWLHRDQRVCRRTPIKPCQCTPCVADRWFGNVELSPDKRRAPANIDQNRDYVRRILLRLTPRYIEAGYGPGAGCRQ